MYGFEDKGMPFGNGGTSKKIIDKIIEIDLNTIVDKEFYESRLDNFRIIPRLDIKNNTVIKGIR